MTTSFATFFTFSYSFLSLFFQDVQPYAVDDDTDREEGMGGVTYKAYDELLHDNRALREHLNAVTSGEHNEVVLDKPGVSGPSVMGKDVAVATKPNVVEQSGVVATKPNVVDQSGVAENGVIGEGGVAAGVPKQFFDYAKVLGGMKPKEKRPPKDKNPLKD